MEKSFEEVLVQFYVDQYRENAKRSTGKPVKLAHYIHRLNSKAKSIKYARFSKNETVALDKLHQEIKRLALITYYSNNKNARGFSKAFAQGVYWCDMYQKYEGALQ